MNKGFAIIPILIVIGLSALGGYFGAGYYLASNKPEPIEKPELGTAANVQYVGNLLTIGTSTLNFEIGTTSESGDRVFFREQVAYSTSTSQDIYDELRVGRSATTTIIDDTIVTGTLTVTSCAGCASGVDLQDVYNGSSADATILSADGKELVYIIANTTDPAEFIVSAVNQGSLQLAIGSTTNQTLFAYGAHGIGTTSPGSGLAVSATSTVLSGIAYVLDHLKTSFLIATSTTNNTFAGALDVTEAATSTFTGGLSVGTGGLLSSTGITLSGGDLLTAGLIKISHTGTSTTAGTWAINSTTGTSSIANDAFIGGNLKVGGGNAVVECLDVSADGIMDLELSNCFKLVPTSDLAISFKNATEDQKFTIKGYLGTTGTGGDTSLSLASTSPIVFETSATTTPALTFIRNVFIGGTANRYFKCGGEFGFGTSTAVASMICAPASPMH